MFRTTAPHRIAAPVRELRIPLRSQVFGAAMSKLVKDGGRYDVFKGRLSIEVMPQMIGALYVVRVEDGRHNAYARQ